MKYECTIKNHNEEEVTVEVGGIEIVCFCNSGCIFSVGDQTTCELTLFDDLLIEATDEQAIIERKPGSYSYNIVGLLDVDNKLLNSIIDFSIDESYIWEAQYWDKKMVKVSVSRIDIGFIS